MSAHFELKALEGSTYVVIVSFFDEHKSTVTPTAITWSLYDDQDTPQVVNSREDVNISVAQFVEIVLSGADVTASPTTGSKRSLVIKATYNSSTLGNGLPLNDVYTFDVHEIPGV